MEESLRIVKLEKNNRRVSCAVKVLSIILLFAAIAIAALSIMTARYKSKAGKYKSILVGQERDYEEMFNDFMESYGRKYNDESEKEYRFLIFVANLIELAAEAEKYKLSFEEMEEILDNVSEFMDWT